MPEETGITNPWLKSLLDALEDMRQLGHSPIRLSRHIIILPPNKPGYKWKQTLHGGCVYYEEVEESLLTL